MRVLLRLAGAALVLAFPAGAGNRLQPVPILMYHVVTTAPADASYPGLYVSRAIMRGFGGDLLYEPKLRGCCFAIVLPSLSNGEEAIDAGISEAVD